MHYTDILRVKLEKETGWVSLSIRVNERKVDVYRISLRDFEVMIADFKAQHEGINKK